eukprot:RCo010685
MELTIKVGEGAELCPVEHAAFCPRVLAVYLWHVALRLFFPLSCAVWFLLLTPSSVCLVPPARSLFFFCSFGCVCLSMIQKTPCSPSIFPFLPSVSGGAVDVGMLSDMFPRAIFAAIFSLSLSLLLLCLSLCVV